MKKYTENPFECKRGNLTIRGTEYRPEGDNLPAAICCHGFIVCQDRVRQYAKAFAEEGYAAYCFDFCGGSAPGTSKSEGKTTEMSVLTEIEDLEAVIRYVKNLPYINDTLILQGSSQGGFVAGLTAAKYKNLVEKLVLIYPALCIPDDARAGSMRAANFDPENIPEEFDCGPMRLGRCYAEAVNQMNAIEEVAKYKGPVLLIHGTEDDIVSIDYSKKVDQALENSKFVIIEGGVHGFALEHDKIAIEAIRKFIQ